MEDDSVTKEMCKQKHDTADRETEAIKAQLKEHELKIQSADVKFVELAGDVRHIKDRIDNGLSKTIYEIRQKMDEFVPLVRESSEWAGRFKQAIFYIAVISVGGGLVSLAFYLLKGFVE
jgi:septal ring factor EnvC (AmiA/AmiB activator)